MINIRLNGLRLLKIRKDRSNNEDLTKHLKKNIPGSNFLSKKIKFTYKLDLTFSVGDTITLNNTTKKYMGISIF